MPDPRPDPVPAPPAGARTGGGFRFSTPTPLRWVDVDSENVVNHAVYLSLMEQARFAYFEQLGLLGGGNIPFVMAEVGCRFLRPGRLRMDVATAARVRRLGRTSFGMDFEVRGDGDLLATSSATLVYVDADLRPAPIAALARERIAAFEQIPPGPVAGVG